MLELFIIALCLTLNALLSCIEMAFVTVSKPHLRKLASEGNTKAQKILTLKASPERVLSVLQIGITLVGAISAAVGGAGAEEVLSPIYENLFKVSEHAAEGLAIVTVVVPLTFLSVVIGELVPKTLALRFPMKMVTIGSYLLQFLDKLFSPVVTLLEVSTRIIINLFIHKLGTENTYDPGVPLDIEGLSDTHKQYVINLIQVDKRKVRDILLPWDLAVKIDKSSHHIEVLDVIKNSRHTRLPVVEHGKPVGILHSKEFIAESEIAKMNWRELVRPVIFIHHDEPILHALKTLQSNKNHMAVIRKNEETLGIVTLEDIFEEVVGDIYDEDDNPQILLASTARIRTMNLPRK
jgi:putative hemolysin